MTDTNTVAEPRAPRDNRNSADADRGSGSQKMSGQRQPRQKNLERNKEGRQSRQGRNYSGGNRRKSNRANAPRGGFRDPMKKDSGEVDAAASVDERKEENRNNQNKRRPKRNPRQTANTQRREQRSGKAAERDETKKDFSSDVKAADQAAGGTSRERRKSRAGQGEGATGARPSRTRPETDRQEKDKSAARKYKAARKMIKAPIVEETFEDLQLKNMRLEKEIMLEIAEIRTIKLD